MAPVQAFPTITFMCHEGHCAKLDPLDDLPRLGFPFVQAHGDEACLLESAYKIPVYERTGNASAPQVGIIFQVLRYRLVGDDIGNGNPAPRFEYAEYFPK